MNRNAKLNNGCLKLFKLLTLLYEDNADYDKVLDIFKEDIEKGDGYDPKKMTNLIQVVLNKYINSLKVFGIKIYKKNNKFRLDSSIFTMDYTIQDLKALSLILSWADSIQDAEITKNISDLKEDLFLRMDNNDKNVLNNFNEKNDKTFFYTDFKDQIDKCKEYVKEGSLLDIVYIYRNKEKKCRCKAIEVLYGYKTAFLSVYDTKKQENLEISIPSILSAESLPTKQQYCIASKTVVYKLTGRLAKTYKLKMNEKLSSKTDDEMIVINKNEPIDKLFPRLMRYSDLCEILTPKYLRREMRNLLNETLSLYEN